MSVMCNSVHDASDDAIPKCKYNSSQADDITPEMLSQKIHCLANCVRQLPFTHSFKEPKKEEISGLLFLELSAWNANETVDNYAVTLEKRKRSIPKVVEEVRNFRVNWNIGCVSDDDRQQSVSIKTFLSTTAYQKTCGSWTLLDCSCSSDLKNICNTCIQLITSARAQIITLINKVEEIERLFPSLRLLCKEFPEYADPEIQNRLSVLYTWINILDGIRLRETLLFRFLGIKNASLHGWPLYCGEYQFEMDTYNASLLESTGISAHHTSESPLTPSTPQTQHIREDPFMDRNRSPYRRFVERALKQHGLMKMLKSFYNLIRWPLLHLCAHLKHPDTNECCTLCGLSPFDCHFISLMDMNLPTLHRNYFFVLGVFVNLGHEIAVSCVERQPKNPAPLSVLQLFCECRDTLAAVVQNRRCFQHLSQCVLGAHGTAVVDKQLSKFDVTLIDILQLYFRYAELRIKAMRSGHISEISFRQRSMLESDWVFARALCTLIPGSESLVAEKFCGLITQVVGSIVEKLDASIQEDVDYFRTSLRHYSSLHIVEFRKRFWLACKRMKKLFLQMYDYLRLVLSFAKTLREDLEIGKEFKVLSDINSLVATLKETGHVQVKIPQRKEVIFVPGDIAKNDQFISKLITLTWGEICDREDDLCEIETGEYLLLCNLPEMPYAWTGKTIEIQSIAATKLTRFTPLENFGLLLIVHNSTNLSKICSKFEHAMGSIIQVVRHHTAYNTATSKALDALKSKIITLCSILSNGTEKIESCFDDVFWSLFNQSECFRLKSQFCEVVHQGFKSAFKCRKVQNYLLSGQSRQEMGRCNLQFAIFWMRFVVERCNPGRGLQPWFDSYYLLSFMWAAHGWEFLQVACDPQHLQQLDKQEFAELWCLVEKCASHLTGSTNDNSINDYKNSVVFHRVHSLSSTRNSSSSDELKNPAVVNGHVWPLPIERVRIEIQSLEETLNAELQKNKRIGRITYDPTPRYHLVAALQGGARKVNFPWQRGIKIGEGRFGSVFTAVNNKTGELICVKKIKLQRNEYRAISKLMDELRIFEGISHSNLVKYYGIEIHRDYLLMFMEYCNEGTLEDACQLELPESLIRSYTRQLTVAIDALHERGIVHRDVKPGNVFLTSDGVLKLGDFGCCIKLKNQCTLPGEIRGFVGTLAYMAPEVFARGEGHGRAADIWSLGCCLIEMTTRKRPWHQLENNNQIMFKVGMGESPLRPSEDVLSEEGQDFLDRCLQHEPRDRWTAFQLLDHPFIQITVLLSNNE